MKKSWLIRALLLTAYCVPFAFFSVKGDITSGTMVYYGVMKMCIRGSNYYVREAFATGWLLLRGN